MSPQPPTDYPRGLLSPDRYLVHKEPQLMRLIARGRLDPSLFVTHRFGLGDTMTVYDTFADPANTGALKVVLPAQNGDRRMAPTERSAAVA